MKNEQNKVIQILIFIVICDPRQALSVPLSLKAFQGMHVCTRWQINKRGSLKSRFSCKVERVQWTAIDQYRMQIKLWWKLFSVQEGWGSIQSRFKVVGMKCQKWHFPPTLMILICIVILVQTHGVITMCLGGCLDCLNTVETQRCRYEMSKMTLPSYPWWFSSAL